MRAENNDSRDGGGAVLGGGGMCSGVWCWRLAVGGRVVVRCGRRDRLID
jgi:hypothetical protein